MKSKLSREVLPVALQQCVRFAISPSIVQIVNDVNTISVKSSRSLPTLHPASNPNVNHMVTESLLQSPSEINKEIPTIMLDHSNITLVSQPMVSRPVMKLALRSASNLSDNRIITQGLNRPTSKIGGKVQADRFSKSHTTLAS